MAFVHQKDEDLEAQVSFLQGQINDLEAMSKYCAKMMNTHICEFRVTTANYGLRFCGLGLVESFTLEEMYFAAY